MTERRKIVWLVGVTFTVFCILEFAIGVAVGAMWQSRRVSDSNFVDYGCYNNAGLLLAD